ncbi:MAG: hypothetical protein LC737_07750, partial [Chloroflexi bacterium]|nr:hypothetical protein [Chloroflexota bacterium]
MTRIICHYETCIFNRDQLCTSKEIEYDPDQGCLTAQEREEFVGLLEDEDEWDEEDELEPDDEEIESEDEELDLEGADDEDDLFE